MGELYLFQIVQRQVDVFRLPQNLHQSIAD
jgi:hypothetical protein